MTFPDFYLVLHGLRCRKSTGLNIHSHFICNDGGTLAPFVCDFPRADIGGFSSFGGEGDTCLIMFVSICSCHSKRVNWSWTSKIISELNDYIIIHISTLSYVIRHHRHLKCHVCSNCFKTFLNYFKNLDDKNFWVLSINQWYMHTNTHIQIKHARFTMIKVVKNVLKYLVNWL